MPFNYVENLQAILNALSDYNTTTATPYLSQSLTTRVVTISDDDPAITSMRQDDYPAVFVRIRSASEEAAALGATGPTRASKSKEVVYDIFALYKREGAVGREAAGQRELHQLARNIEGIFQQEYRLSATALFCHPEATDFVGPVEGKNGVMVNGAMITLRAKYHFR